jgi:signal transduction histidine kinase
MYSLKKRITRNLTLNLLVVMTGLLIAIYFFAQQLLHDYIQTHLQHDAESIASVIHQDQAQQWKIDPGRMSAVYNRVRSGHYYTVAIDQQVIRSRSLFDADFPEVREGHVAYTVYLANGPGDERWMIWHQAVEKNGQAIRIWIAEDIAPLRRQLLQYAALIFGMIVMVAALLFYLQQRTLRQAFEVFDWLRTNLMAIRQKEAERSGVSMPLEVAPLVTEIEKLVEHLSHRIVRTRNAMGNLAHELKRPLQLLSIQQEGGQDAENRNTLDEIRNILERELRRAKISGSSGVGGVFDLAEEIYYLINVLRKIYPDIGIEVEFDSPIEAAGLDRDDMLELIGNLLDNACKFARSRARLTVSSANGRLELAFEDDGPGLETTQLQQLNRRGQRLDESVAGHGLGLGICRDILDYYRGDLSFAKSSLGGLVVTVQVPLS